MLSREAARDLAERVYCAWNEGGAETVAREFWHPDVIFRDDPAWPDSSVVRGRDATVARLDSITEGLGDFKCYVVEALPFPGGALAGVRFQSVGPSSGAATQMVIYHVGWLRDGLFTEVRSFLRRDDALAAAGLEPTPPD
jgi:SnoaL-like domain